MRVVDAGGRCHNCGSRITTLELAKGTGYPCRKCGYEPEFDEAAEDHCCECEEPYGECECESDA